MPDFILNDANASQREAITFEGPGPLLVLAGPGSGKTHVITKRVQFLTQAKGVPPEKILVLTFTKDAAISMKNRYLNANPSVKQTNVSQTVKQENVSRTVNYGTFHSVFYQILKQSHNFQDKQILTDAEKKRILQPIIDELLPNLNFLERGNLWTELLPAISFIKNTGNEKEATRKITTNVTDCFQEIIKRYEEQRKYLCKLDFDDMLTDCHDLLLENESVRSYWQSRFEHILIDEFQDVNPAQYEVIKLLSKKPYHIFAVGDDDQSIYGFRGADPDCMKRFAREFNAKIVRLNVNYRSTQTIVEASSKLISKNHNRFQKTVNSSEEIQPDLNKKIRGVETRAFEDKESQYGWLIDSCKERLNDKKEEEMAILFRTNRILQRYAMKMHKENIPFLMREKIKNPYQNEYASDVLAYLKLARGLDAAESLIRIINKPSRFITREILGKCRERAVKGEGIMEVLCEITQNGKTEIREKIIKLTEQMNTLKNLSPYTAVLYVRKVIGYERWIEEQYRGNSERREDAKEILEWLAETSKDQNSVEEWLQEINDWNFGNVAGKDDGIDQTSQKGRIHLMTVHAAKGLEFDKVIIPDVNERVFPHGSFLDEKALEEERRVFYVGMTRAKKELLITYVAGTKDSPGQPSRFIEELK